MNRSALISDTDKLPLETVSDAERRSNGVRFSEIGICHVLNFYPDLARMFRDGKVTHMNRSGAAFLGLKFATEASGYRLADLPVPELFDVADEIVSQMLDEDEPFSARMRTGTGQAFSVQMTTQCARAIDDGLMLAKLLRLDAVSFDANVTVSRLAHLGPDFFVTQARDISEHRRAVMALDSANLDLEVRVRGRTHDLEEEVERRRSTEEKLRDMANHDNLTGLPNRGHLLDVFKMEIEAAEEKPRMMAVMYVDLDGFKAVNDTLGHDTGDVLLKIVAQRLKGCIRRSDLAARIGGDKFVVGLRNVKAISIVESRAREIVEMMGGPFEVGGERSANIGASVGVALFPDDAANPDSLLNAADSAMYGVKASGKSAVAFAS